MPNNEELIQAGIAALKAGDSKRAFTLLTQAVRADPASELGWLWLGKSCAVPEQKEYSFRRVLKINPENIEARLQLEKLLKPPAAASPTGAVVPFTNDPPVQAASTPTPPAAAGEKEQPPADGPAPAAETPVEPEPVKKARKPISRIIGIGLVLSLVCLAGAAYLFVTGKLTAWLPIQLAATQTSPPLPTLTATPTPSATPTATITPTPTSPPAAPTAKPTIAYAPAYESIPCKFEKPAGVTVNCGYVTVPQDRTDESSGTVQLAVVVYHSTSSSPAAEPVVFLQGGPGGEAVMMSANGFSVLVEPFLADRDFIAFDQRGTGLSKPVLDCQDLESVYKQDIHGQLTDSSRDFTYTNAFRACHGSMRVEGINTNSYTTFASADDLKDVVTALGYIQVDLYGASYGTRLALVTMKNHPEIVKNVILDSVVPVEAKLFNDDPLRYESSLQALFDGCAADPLCKAAYPDLETVFWDLVASLDNEPVSVTAPLLTGGGLTETVDGSDLIGVTLGLLKTTKLIASVPESIYRIKAGDYSTFIAMQTALPYEFQGVNLGLYISIMCHEQILATTPQDLQAAMDSKHDIGRYFRLPFFGNAQNIFDTCQVWDSVPPASGENDPVASDIPTLIIEGAYDPATPPFYGKQVAANLSHSFYVEFSNQGHCPTAADTSGCAMKMAVAFLNNPGRTPENDCTGWNDRVQFLRPYDGTPPVGLQAVEETAFTASLPVEWVKLAPGFYFRNSSPSDITQVAVFTTSLNANEITSWLSSKLYGYGRADSNPVQSGIRNANGLTWTLYTTSSYGRPLELAIASSKKYGALVVVLFCHEDEHEALYQTVYLPIINSVTPKP